MRYIEKSVVVEAFVIKSVGIGGVAGVSQPHMTPVTLDDGTVLQLSTNDLQFGIPEVGDYWVNEKGFMHKAQFEEKYVHESDSDVKLARAS